MEINLQPIDVWYDPAIETYRINGVPGNRVSHILNLWPQDWAKPWVAKETVERVRELWAPGIAHQKDAIDTYLLDAKKAYKRKSVLAVNIGQSVHDWISTFILQNHPAEMPSDPDAVNCINAFLDWKQQNQIEWIESEITVADIDNMYAGRFDALAVINGKLTILDFKTSNRMSETYKYQLAAYQHALEKMGCDPIDERLVLRFPKKKPGKGEKIFEPEAYPRSTFRQDINTFLCALEFYKCLNNGK